MKIQSFTAGTPCWLDLMTPDPDAASSFYEALFGWDIFVGTEETGGYRMCQLGDDAIAGIVGMPMPDLPPAWRPYIKVDDAAATIAGVQGAGGEVLFNPSQVMELGIMGVFADPQGAILGIWQPLEFQGAGLVAEPGAYIWSELVTSDLDAAGSFYASVFDWVATPTTGGAPDYAELSSDGASIAGMMPRPEMLPAEVPNYWGVYFVTASMTTALATVADKGGQLILDCTEIPMGSIAIVTDPTGAMFGLLEPSDLPA